MNKIKQLESKKLIKELEYIQSDYNYRIELISEADSEFLKSLNSFLEKNPDIKEIFDNKINKKIEELFHKKIQEIDNSNSESQAHYKNEDTTEVVEKVDLRKIKLKKLYREIVKSTHPDRVTNNKLNELYLRATEFYNNNDFSGTYSICVELDIFFEIDEEEIRLINEQIFSLKNRIEFLEKTLTWKWFNSEDQTKENIMLQYIKLRLND